MDSRILRNAIDGDSEARRELIGGYRPLIRLVVARYARRVLSRRFDESDLVQLTCLEAFKGFERFRGTTRAEFSSWLETILERNLIKQWRFNVAQQRDYRREEPISANDHGGHLSIAWHDGCHDAPARKLLRDELALIVAEAMDQLPPTYREPVELRFIDGLSLRAVADQLQVSVGTVAGRLRRGLEMLGSVLPPEARGMLEGPSE